MVLGAWEALTCPSWKVEMQLNGISPQNFPRFSFPKVRFVWCLVSSGGKPTCTCPVRCQVCHFLPNLGTMPGEGRV